MLSEATASAAGSISRSAAQIAAIVMAARRKSARRRGRSTGDEPPGSRRARACRAPSALTTISSARRVERGVDTPWMRGSERSKASSASPATPRPSERQRRRAPGWSTRRRARGAAGSARLAPGSRRMTRRATHASGPRQRQRAATRDRRHADLLRRRQPVADGRRASRRSGSRSPRRRSGPPARRSTHSCGLRTLEDRAKVSRANSSRRVAPMRVARSSTCSSMARAARRLASSVSCFCLLAREFRGRRVGRRRRSRFDLGVSSARRFADAASRGVRSAIAACKATPSGSFSARRRCRSASVRFLSFSAASIAVSAARVGSRSSGCASCAEARPSVEQGERENDPAQKAQGGRRLHRRQDGHRG